MKTEAAQGGAAAPTGPASAAATASTGAQPAAGAGGEATGGTGAAAPSDAGPTGSIIGGAVKAEGDKGAQEQAGGKQGDQGAGSKDPTTAGGELVIKLPEGMKADEKLLASYTTLAKEIGLDSEKASKAAAWHVEQQRLAVDAQAKSWEQQGKAWVEELKADPTFGKDFDANVKLAQKAALKFGKDTGLVEFLERYGLGNAPPVVKALSAIGRAVAEDDSGAPTTNQGQPDDEQAKLRRRYPSMFNEDGTPRL